MCDGKPPTAAELARAKAAVGRGYPLGFETAQQVARGVAQLALHGLPDDHFARFVPALDAVEIADVAAAAARHVRPQRAHHRRRRRSRHRRCRSSMPSAWPWSWCPTRTSLRESSAVPRARRTRRPGLRRRLPILSRALARCWCGCARARSTTSTCGSGAASTGSPFRFRTSPVPMSPGEVVDAPGGEVAGGHARAASAGPVVRPLRCVSRRPRQHLPPLRRARLPERRRLRRTGRGAGGERRGRFPITSASSMRPPSRSPS